MPQNLPISLSSFVGREQEQAQLLGLVLQQDARLVTLTGPGGVGKTRLALQVAGQVVDRHLDARGELFRKWKPVEASTNVHNRLGVLAR